MSEQINDDALFDPRARALAERLQDLRARDDWALRIARESEKNTTPGAPDHG